MDPITACSECDLELAGARYCPACGQAAVRPTRRLLRGLMAAALISVAALDLAAFIFDLLLLQLGVRHRTFPTPWLPGLLPLLLVPLVALMLPSCADCPAAQQSFCPRCGKRWKARRLALRWLGLWLGGALVALCFGATLALAPGAYLLAGDNPHRQATWAALSLLTLLLGAVASWACTRMAR